MTQRADSRAAVVQDWFFAPGGSEEVAIELARLLPGCDVFTSFCEPAYRERLPGHRVRTWPPQRILGASKRYRNFLPLYPLWFGNLDLGEYDLVVSNSTGFAKAVRTRRGAAHIAIVHSPLRYAWDLDRYLDGSSVSGPGRLAARLIGPALRRWDRSTAARPDVIVTSSNTMRRRIWQVWGREARVVHPPVPLDDIELSPHDDGYVLIAARMLAYRRLDVAISAANALGRDLLIVGTGPENRGLRSLAGPTVRFVGMTDRAHLRDLMARCHAYLVPGEEDFGMAPVEAMAAGKPVVALGAGGALETVIDGVTGVHVDPAAPDPVAAFAAGIRRLDSLAFDPATIRAHALSFAPVVFRTKFRALFAELGVDPSSYRAEET